MNQQPWSKPLVIVRLPAEPQLYDELETVTQVAVNQPGSDILIDLEGVERIDPRSMLSLIILKGLLKKSTRRLGFCHIHPAVEDSLRKRGLCHDAEEDSGQAIVLETPASTEVGGALVLSCGDAHQEKRHYRRLNLSKLLNISVELWHADKSHDPTDLPPARYWEGTLADICEGGGRLLSMS